MADDEASDSSSGESSEVFMYQAGHPPPPDWAHLKPWVFLFWGKTRGGVLGGHIESWAPTAPGIYGLPWTDGLTDGRTGAGPTRRAYSGGRECCAKWFAAS